MRSRLVSMSVALLAIVAAAPAASAADPRVIAGRWSIVAIAGKALRAPGTINFTRIRWLGLNTACGPLWGWYRRSGTMLRIHITGAGRFQVRSGSPCEGVDYRIQLGRVRSYSAEPDSLLLLDQNGKAIARLTPKS